MTRSGRADSGRGFGCLCDGGWPALLLPTGVFPRERCGKPVKNEDTWKHLENKRYFCPDKSVSRILMRNSSLSYGIFLFLLLFPRTGAASGWNSFIVNFDKSAYGKGTQTWQIAPYDEKWTYFANKNGMVQFDGNIWNVFPMNNASEVRSVLPSAAQKRIYAGGINEFGYYEPGADGSLNYRCMSDTLASEVRLLGNVWGIHEADNILYFQGDDRVVRYLNGKYTAVGMNAKIDCSNVVNGVLYVGTDRGVWFMVGNAFFPLQGADALASKRIRGIIPYKKG